MATSDFGKAGRVLIVLCLLMGCGDGKTDKTEPAADSNSNRQAESNAYSSSKTVAERLVGSWKGKIHIDDGVLKSFAEASNMPLERAEEMRSKLQSRILYFAFDEGGTAKAGNESNGILDVTPAEWKVENESGNKARLKITHTERRGPTPLIDVEFQSDDKFVGRSVQEEGERARYPDYEIHFERIDKIPEPKKS
jgi:hypothetical protein